MVAWIETVVLKERWDVDKRLTAIGLSREGLLRVRGVAINAAGNATPNHCANAAGTFGYQSGTWALRHEYVGSAWAIDRTDGVESIFNRELNIRVAFSNVDVACDDEQEPSPRSSKGSGSERLCEGNLFEHLPRFTKLPSEKCATFYLMTAPTGACELSRPVITNGEFSSFVERLYLSNGRDEDGARLPLSDDDAVADFDPVIVRKPAA